MVESESTTEPVRLVVAPRLVQAAAALTLLRLLCRAVGYDLAPILSLDLKSPLSWLWQLPAYALLQLPGSTGIAGQILMCGALYWAAAELERALGARRTASFLVASAVGTALLTFVVASSAHRLGRIAGADGLILSALGAYAWLHPDRPLPRVEVEGLKRHVVVGGLVLAGAVQYAIDGDRVWLIARVCAVLVGLVAWRVDLGPVFDRLLVAGAGARERSAGARALLPAVVNARWGELSQRLRGELARASLPPPPDAMPSAASRYWDAVDPALPLALVDPLRKER